MPPPISAINGNRVQSNDAVTAGEKLDAGATLVQIYTGMIFRGPFLAAQLAYALADRQRR